VLREVDLDVSRGQLLLLLGPSGSGKSTLARVLAGVIPQGVFAEVSGAVLVNGLDPRRAEPARVSSTAGLLFQDPQSGFAMLTVEDEIAFGLENLAVPPGEMPGRIRAALRQVGMGGSEARPLLQLSGGEAQRVALAALLAMHPAVLLLDEPTANLDPAGTREFFARLARLKPDRAIVLIEHKLDACLKLADRVLVLGPDGRPIASGDPQTVLRRHRRRLVKAGVWLPARLEPKRRPVGAPKVRSDLPPAVRTTRLTYAYPGGPHVLTGVDLEVPQGDFVALVGPNGSGKSTLARLWMGLLPAPRDTIEVFATPQEVLSEEELAERLGYVFQNPEHQFVRDTVREELAFSLQTLRRSPSEIGRRVGELLARFDLAGVADRNPFTLSQGQKRRLSVAAMLASGQRMLILDEPTFGQDRASAHALMESLRSLNRSGVTIVFITHDMRFVRQYARRAVVLVRGRCIFDGSPAALFRNGRALDRARLR
jgi:energy-coupling factor transport system ATP-binding protein